MRAGSGAALSSACLCCSRPNAHGSEVVLADVLANEFLQPLDGLDLRLLALLPEPLEFGEFVGVLDVLVVPPHGVETLAQVVDHVVVVVPDRLGLANEIVLLNVFVAHGASPFRVKITFVKRARRVPLFNQRTSQLPSSRVYWLETASNATHP